MAQSVKAKTMWKTASKDEKPIWRKNMWVASGKFSLSEYYKSFCKGEKVKRRWSVVI